MNKTIVQLMLVVVQAIANAILTSRNEPEKVIEVKKDADQKIQELEGALSRGFDDSEEAKQAAAQVAELRSELDSAVVMALAARPPGKEQIEVVTGTLAKA